MFGRRRRFRRPRPRRLALLLTLAALIAGGAYVFTASNTVPASQAGEGEGTVSGYTASSIVWTLDPVNPANIQKVAFSLNPVTASSVVYAGADNGSTITWSSACVQSGLSGGTATETCTFGTEPSTNATIKLAVASAN